METESQCKHNRISRNCYLCHMEFVGGTLREKSEIDAPHKNLSDLMVRVSKLEEYKRLQDDRNIEQSKISDRIYDCMHDFEKELKEINKCIFDLNDFQNQQIFFNTSLEDHRRKQIDENRAVSKHLDQLDQDNAELNSRQNDLTTEIEMLHAWRVSLDDRIGIIDGQLLDIKIYSHPMQEKVWQENISKRIEDLEATNQKAIDTNPIKDEIVKAHADGSVTVRCVGTGSIPKTTGLTFEEAIVAFKAFKTIKRRGWIVWGITHKDESINLTIDDVIATDWEILE